jgi:hypothetical protein
VKGTQFTVTVTSTGSRVGVVSGKVEVNDLKSGQHALVLPGQAAKVFSDGKGLSLSGSGTLGPVLPGEPRAPVVEPASKNGLSTAAAPGLIRIAQPLGEMKLDVYKATKGIAHEAGVNSSGRDKDSGTVWNSRELSPGNSAAEGNKGGGNSGGGNGGGGGNSGGGGLGSGLGNGIGHLVCNIKSKGKSGC